MSSPAKNLTTRQLQAIARRKQIIETAVNLFAQYGIDGTSTKKIAMAAGISEGLIFHYFPTKAILISAILESQHGFVSDLCDFLRDAGDQPVGDVLERVAFLWLARLRKEKAITLVMFGAAQTNPEMGEALQMVIQTGVQLLSGYLDLKVSAGELRSDLPLKTAALMFFSSLMIFFVTRRDLIGAEWQEEVDRFVDEMLSVWLAGTQN